MQKEREAFLMRRKDLALRVLSTATFLAMVASCITPAFAGTYYIEDGNITIETEGDRVKVNGEYDDDEEIIIKGGSNPDKTNEAAENQPEEKTETSTEAVENTVEVKDKEEETETVDVADTEKESSETEETPEEGESQDDPETQADGEQKEKQAEQEQGEETPAEKVEVKAPVEKTEEETKPQQNEETTEKETAEQEVPASVSKTVKMSDDREENSSTSSGPVKNVIKVVNNWVDKILNITLDNVKIDVSGTGSKTSSGYTDQYGEAAVSIKGSGDTTIHLEGQNELKGGAGRAAIEKNDNEATGKLTITADADDDQHFLEAVAGTGAAGIGSREEHATQVGPDARNIVIAGGKIKAYGDNMGAGIGGGRRSNAEVTITGGDIWTRGGSFAAGIGGASGRRGKVTITGGKVEARTNGSGAAIGGGNDKSGSGDITITGGVIDAIGDNQYTITVGIGGGVECTEKTIVRITGGIVNAIGFNGGSGIGAGRGDTQVAEIEISGTAQVTARGGTSLSNGAGAAIGTGGSANGVNGTEAKINEENMTTGAIIRENPNVAAGHVHNWTEVSHTDAGIDQRGETNFVCADENCGATKTEYAPITGHDWDDGEITTAPTCTEKGVRTYTCKNDDATKTEGVPALGHDYGEWVADGQGHKTRTCKRCNASETVADENYVAPVDPIPDIQPGESSDSAAAAYEALTVVGAPAYEQTVENNRVVIAVPTQSASLCGSLGALKELKAQGAEILVFRTQLCESVVSIDSLLARGSDETIFVLTHTESNATLTVAGQNADALLNQ